MPEYKYGKNANRQQGTQSPSIAKSRPAAAYGRSSQRASPTGSTTFDNEWKADKDARDRKHQTGKYSRQVLFP